MISIIELEGIHTIRVLYFASQAYRQYKVEKSTSYKEEKSTSYQDWIVQGYFLFGMEGLEGIKVERLARSLFMNKSSFYHYFGDRDTFLEHLMNHHQKLASVIAQELSAMKEFVPEFVSLLLKYKATILVHMQLVRYRDSFLFQQVYEEINEKFESALLPSWSVYLGIPHNPEFARKYFAQARGMFYSKITNERMNEIYLRELVEEVKGLMQEFIR